MKARFKLAVILAALCAGLLVPRALTAAAGSSGPRPLPPAAKALLDRGTYTGDLDVMLRKRAVRVLTTYSQYSLLSSTRVRLGGVTYDYMRAVRGLPAEVARPQAAEAGDLLRPDRPASG